MNKQLENLRTKIDELDDNLFDILAKRILLVKRIGELKKQYGLDIVDEKRKDEKIKFFLKKAKTIKLPGSFAREFYTIIHANSIEIQKETK